MKKLYFIIFFSLILVGLIGNAAKIENDYLDRSDVAVQSLSEDVFSNGSQEKLRLDQQQLMTLGLLFGTGLVGLLIIRRK